MSDNKDPMAAEQVELAGEHVREMSTMTAAQIGEAYRAAQTEHRMGFWQALKIYKKSLFWSAVMSLVSTKSSEEWSRHS